MTEMTIHEMGERVDRLTTEIHSLACHAPTTPVMTSLDMALMYLRHAQSLITHERRPE